LINPVSIFGGQSNQKDDEENGDGSDGGV